MDFEKVQLIIYIIATILLFVVLGINSLLDKELHCTPSYPVTTVSHAADQTRNNSTAASPVNNSWATSTPASNYPVSYSGYTPTPAATPSPEPASNVNTHVAAPLSTPSTTVSSVSSDSFDAWKPATISASASQSKSSYSSDNNSSSSYSDPLWTIKPNAYGMGVGENQYGQPVKIVPAH